MLNVLDATGDGASLFYGSIGTLTEGTLAGPGTLTGRYGGAVVAVGAMTVLGRIYDMAGNEIDVPKVDTMILSAAANESQPGTPDYGEVSVVLAYSSVNAATITSWIANKTVQFFKLTVDDYTVTDTAMPFLGWAMKFTPISGDIKKDETLKAKLTVKITGVPLLISGT